MSTSWPNEDELTEESIVEYELTEKWLRVGKNESELISYRPNSLKPQLFGKACF